MLPRNSCTKLCNLFLSANSLWYFLFASCTSWAILPHCCMSAWQVCLANWGNSLRMRLASCLAAWISVLAARTWSRNTDNCCPEALLPFFAFRSSFSNRDRSLSKRARSSPTTCSTSRSMAAINSSFSASLLLPPAFSADLAFFKASLCSFLSLFISSGSV